MPDDLIDRVAEDVAAGRHIDWPAALALANSAGERLQLESLRVVYQMARGANDGTITEAAATLSTARSTGTTDVLPSRAATWGRYVLLHELGTGSFGTVYKAVDPNLQLDVAIKVLHRHVDDDLLRERLIDEGRALARIRHQNVVRVHAVEVHGDRVGLCTEYIDGETLEAEVRAHGTFSQAQAMEIGEAMCQALAAVHRAGFIHRDVKARNVMRERDTGRIVLMDFGTGRELERELASLTFELAGTAIYMAPELLENLRASKASDVYSVGVLLYHVLTGAYPVEGVSFAELKAAHRRGLRTPLGERRADLSPAFVRVVEKALSPKRSRYATPAALWAALDAVHADRPRWIQWAKTATTVAAAGCGALIGLGFVNTFYFNSVLGRAGYVEDGVLEWLKWGAKGVLAPLVIAAFITLAVTLLAEILQLLTRFSSAAYKVARHSADLIHRSSLDDIAVLSSFSLLSSAAILFAAWWYFTPLLGTLTSISPDISTVPIKNLALLSPEYGDYHVSYRKTFVGTTLACVMLWFPTLRLAVRTRQRVPRRSIIGGCIVLAFSLLLLDFPYRLLTQDIFFDEVTWDGHSCHVLGARNDERLIFCPSLPVPRNRAVPAARLTPLHSPAIGLREDGNDAKRRRSIFKFLLRPAAAAREASIP
jgi:serine/threonine protein kinase